MCQHSHSRLHTFIHTADFQNTMKMILDSFSPSDIICFKLMQFCTDVLKKLRSLQVRQKKRTITQDFTLRYWRSLIQVFVFSIFVLFDMFMIFFWVKYALKRVISGWVFRLSRMTNTDTVRALNGTVIGLSNQSVHIQLQLARKDISFDPSSISFNPPRLFPSCHHLLAGEIHIAHLQLY